MQTFLPYADFEASARALDPKRLGKQRVEAIQVIRALTVPGYGWRSHPAALMWKGHEEALGRYGLTVCEVWLELGFGDTCAATIVDDLARAGIPLIRSYAELADAGALPPWLFDEHFLRSHRSALVRKDPEFYGPRFADADADLPYHWPVRAPEVVERERRRAENAERRRQRALEREAERRAAELAEARRRRSEAARRGWATRQARASVVNPDESTA